MARNKIRGKKPALDRFAILSAALRISDTDGLNGMTMRKLGDALGVEAMSLYHYVRNRDDVLDGIVELVIREIAGLARGITEPGENWRIATRKFVSAYRTIGARHPEAFRLLTQRPLRTAASRESGQTLIDTLLAGGMSKQHAVLAYRALTSFVAGFVVLENSGMEPAYWTGSFDEEFEAGLDIIIGGIETRLF